MEVSLARGELRVRDHGPGFSEEDRPLVFDRFYRSAAARAMPGAGLGLVYSGMGFAAVAGIAALALATAAALAMVRTAGRV